jgi:hypothetical protein
MVKPITAQQLSILKIVAKHPGAEKEKLLALAGVTEADLKYLEENDMIREREAGRYRIAHFGELVLRRGN